MGPPLVVARKTSYSTAPLTEFHDTLICDELAALAASPVGPVRSLGIWSAVGIAAMTAFAFTLLPALLRIGEERGARQTA